MADALGKTVASVTQMAMKIGVNGVNYKEWTDGEIDLVRRYYRTVSFADLIRMLPNHPKASIKKVASSLRLRRQSKGMDLIMADLSVLMGDSVETMYWLGFLLADGHFSKQNRLRLLVATKDKGHLQRFADFIRYQGKISHRDNAVFLAVMDQWWVSEVKKRYDIANDKTYNPPHLDRFTHLNDDQILALIIGFIDGDGSIIRRKDTKTCNLAIKNHASWLPFLNLVSETLERTSGIPLSRAAINSSGYASLIFSNHPLNKFVKSVGKRLNLPVLERKWSRIDETHVNRYETRKIIEPIVLDMLKKGIVYREIAEKTGMSESSISNVANRNGLGRK